MRDTTLVCPRQPRLSAGLFTWLLGVLSFMVVPVMPQAAEDRARKCEELWAEESARVAGGPLSADHRDLLSRWQELGQRCRGTIVYEARLAMAHALVGEGEQARKVLAPLRGAAGNHAPLVDLAALEIDYFEAARGRPSREVVARLEAQFALYVRRYPQVAEGHAQLGGLRTMLGRHAEAIPALEQGLRSSMDVSGVYRNLTISHAALGQFPEAIRAADTAVDRAPAVMSDPDFVYAAARAAAAVGQIQGAVDALNLLATKSPAVRDDPEFWKAAEFVKARKAAR